MHSERTARLRLDAERQKKANRLFPLIHVRTAVILVSMQVISCRKYTQTYAHDNILHSTGEARRSFPRVCFCGTKWLWAKNI
jgi:hypothetical protein